MTRKPPPKPEQLSIFDYLPETCASAAGTRSWAAIHWPAYVAGRRNALPAPAAIVLWAESFTDMAKGSRALLLALAHEADTVGRARMCLPSLAHLAAMGRNTCKRHLDRLLLTGLVMMKVWSEPTSRGPRLLGYQFRLIVDVEDRAMAISDGFSSTRPMGRANG